MMRYFKTLFLNVLAFVLTVITTPVFAEIIQLPDVRIAAGGEWDLPIPRLPDAINKVTCSVYNLDFRHAYTTQVGGGGWDAIAMYLNGRRFGYKDNNSGRGVIEIVKLGYNKFSACVRVHNANSAFVYLENMGSAQVYAQTGKIGGPEIILQDCQLDTTPLSEGSCK